MRYFFCILCALALTAALPASLGAAPASSGNSGAAVLTDARFTALDADGNGRVTWEEFHKTNESISRQGFDLMDINKNGELSLEEWRAFAASHGMNISMPSSQVTVPARPLDPPVAPNPGQPTLPLIMPPADPDSPAAAESGAAASPEPARVEKPSLPLLMPPAESTGPTPPGVTPPAGPSVPAVPLVTPPALSSPAKGSSGGHRP
ncbi:MAG: EF-hand domain-containing protein [Desulfovibrionaceae bacterium]|nr:EF-hand domain-containing protein [Desulfovibrionaceae bacterium]